MATSFKITDGTTEYELFYDAVSQTKYKQLYGAQLQGVQPNVLMHQPDFDSAVPVRGFNPNRQLYLNLHVPADTTWDGVYDAVTDINRMVDGRDSQALRYWTDGDVNRVVVRVQQDGATNYTDIPVLFGSVNIDTAYFNPTAELNKWGLGVVIALNVTPHGEGAAISLHNDLPSSPHFIEDSDSDGLADGWALYGTGVSSTSIETTSYLVGGKSQEFTTDNTNLAGITLDYPCTGDNTAGYAWVRWASGEDTISIEIWEVITTGRLVAGTTITYNNGNGAADKTCVDSAGNTWYRVSVTGGVSPPATTCQLRVFRSAGNATEINSILVDACYARDDVSTVPDAWCSTSDIENRYDPDSSNEDQINYFDVWGVPGDGEADVIITKTGGSPIQVVSHNVSGIYEANDPKFTIDSNDFAVAGGWTRTVDASRWGGGYMTSSIPNASPCELNLTSTGDPFPVYTTFGKPVRVLAVCWVSNSATTFSMRGILGSTTLDRTEEKSLVATSTYEVVDLGLLNLGDVIDRVDTNNITFNFEVFATGSTGTSRIVGVYLQRTRNLAIHSNVNETRGFTSYSDTQTAYNSTETGGDAYQLSTLGNIARLTPRKMNRYTFIHIGQATTSDMKYLETFTANISLSVTPRTRHLLGVK